uniref:Uncharacterized protein n=1 Tax=Parascaris equorum TaxID=6256 RepID=A0A914RU50_PAREQ
MSGRFQCLAHQNRLVRRIRWSDEYCLRVGCCSAHFLVSISRCSASNSSTHLDVNCFCFLCQG